MAPSTVAVADDGEVVEEQDEHDEQPAGHGPTGVGRRLALHALLHLALLVGLLVATDLRVGWNFDDGAYATQVEVLDQTGSWAYPYRHLDVDPTSRFAPVYLSTTTADASYPYTKLPAWIEVLRPSVALFGSPVGFAVPSVAGAVLAAVAAGLLAERLRRGTAALGYWAVALGPLVVHATATWAHTVAAAAGGMAALVVVALASARERWWHLGALAAVLAALGAVRAEGTLFAVAVAAVAGGLLVARPGALRARVGRAAAWVLPLLAVGGGVRLASAAWARHLSPGAALDDPDAVPPPGLVSARAQGAVRTLVDGLGASSAGTVLALLGLVLAAAGGAVVARRPARARDGWFLVALGLAVVVARSALVAPDDLGGLLVAVPVVAVALGAWRWSAASPAARAVAALVLLHGAAVLATQYAEGGSRDWGGRFLFPVLVPVVVLAVLTLRPLLPEGTRRIGPWAAPVASVVLLAAVAVPTAAGWRAAERARASNRAFGAALASVEPEVPTVIGLPRYLVRTDWGALPERDRLGADADTVVPLLALLRPGRTEPVAVVGNGAEAVRAPGWRREVRSPVVVVFHPV